MREQKREWEREWANSFLTTLELFEPADTSPSPNIAPWDSSESFKIIKKKISVFWKFQVWLWEKAVARRGVGSSRWGRWILFEWRGEVGLVVHSYTEIVEDREHCLQSVEITHRV